MKKGKSLEDGAKLEIIFVGRSNVGKSSFIRDFTGKKKVRVGKRPGVTLIPHHIRYSDMLITDMPGFGFMSGVHDSKQNIVKDTIIEYIEDNSDRINMAVMIVDGATFLDLVERWNARNEIPIDIEMFDFLREMGIDTVVAVNKIDKINPDELEMTLDGIADCLGMMPPWRQWLDTIAPITVKKGDTKALRGLIRKRLHDAKRDDLFKYIPNSK
ncbi:MAG TPA: GTP-binding protein EngB [Methanosarcinaceae archaeon]|nr:GTP-binding protein EngB [Methanosarcinaceae archaeon]